MDPSTKTKILNTSIDRFNTEGVANVRMQHIADDLGMSPGNLAYHFRTKDALMEAIIHQLFEEVDDMQKTFRIYPNLLDFDLQLNKYFELVRKYPFYFSDIIEINRHFPELMSKRKNHIEKLIVQLHMRLEFNVKRGVIVPERSTGLYEDLAETIWMIITFFPTKRELIEDVTIEVERHIFMKKVWNLIQPWFTDKGQNEYKTLIEPLLNTNNIRQ